MTKKITGYIAEGWRLNLQLTNVYCFGKKQRYFSRKTREFYVINSMNLKAS